MPGDFAGIWRCAVQGSEAYPVFLERLFCGIFSFERCMFFKRKRYQAAGRMQAYCRVWTE